MFASDPMVHRDNEGYHLFHTTLFCKKGAAYHYAFDPANPQSCSVQEGIVVTTAYAFSSDRGLTWTYRSTPVILPGPSEFDSKKIETPSIVRVENTLFMFYAADGTLNGSAFGGRYQIGVATLDLGSSSIKRALLVDKRTFNKRSSPILARNMSQGAFDSNVQEPSVIWKNNKFELFYSALALSLPDKPNGVSGQSLTGVSLGVAYIDKNLNLFTRSQSPIHGGKFSDIPVSKMPQFAEVRFINNKYHVFSTKIFENGTFHENEKINHFSSPDLIVWSEPQVLLEGGSDNFNNWGIMAPTIVLEDDAIHMFYTAFEKADKPCYPIPSNGRFGLPLVGEGKCVFATVGRATAQQ